MRKVFIILSFLIAFMSVSFSQTTDYGYSINPDLTSTSANTILPMGGAFNVGELGNATYSLPVEVPAGINGMQPSLSINYNSLAGNGICGLGFNLGGLSAISRVSGNHYYDGKTSDMVANSSYIALSMDGQRLITGSNGKFYVESDPNVDITLKNDTVTVRQNGKTLIYKKINNNCQVYYLSSATDVFGNKISYSYFVESNCVYPSSISYGVGTGSVTISFVYEARPDFVNCFSTIPFQIKKRLSKIDVKKNAALWRSYGLLYSYSNGFSKIVSITEKNSKGEQKYPTEFSWGGTPAPARGYQQLMFMPNENGISFKNKDVVAGDFNNDGIDDIAFMDNRDVYFYISNNNCVLQFQKKVELSSAPPIPEYRMADIVKYITASQLVTDIDGNGRSELLVVSRPKLIVEQKNKVYVSSFKFCDAARGVIYEYDYKSSNADMPFFSVGDFLSNGKTQILLCGRSWNGEDYYYFGFLGIEEGKNNKDIKNIALAQLRLTDVPECIMNGDFDGDGLLDILVVTKNRSEIYWNRGWDPQSDMVFHPSTQTYIPNINTNCAIIRVGDFDGDGVSDILYNVKGESTFNIVKNKGNRTFTTVTAINLPEIYDITDTKKDDDKFCVEITDFNCDGKADILISKAMYKQPKRKKYYRHTNNYDFWLKSEGDKFTIAHKLEWDFEVNSIYHQHIVGDFNGDGHPECMRLDVDDKWYMYYPFLSRTLADNYNKITRISQDNGVYTSITYSNLTDNHIYQRAQLNRYPVLEPSFPLPVVSSVTQSNGVAPNGIYSYTYGQLLAHVKGKGLLGFEIRNIDLKHTSQSVYTAINKWDSNYYIPTEIYSSRTNSEIINSTTTVSVAAISGKRYYAYPSQITQKDQYGKTTVTTNTYNATKGYIESSKTVFPDNSYKLKKYQNYVLAGGVFQPKLIVAEQKHPDDNNPYSTQQYIEYNLQKGHVTKSIENYKTDFALTTQYKYDNYGNITKKSTFGKGNDTISTAYKYDSSHRLVIEKNSKPLNTVTKYTYDQFDNLTSETDATDKSNPLKTTYKYDNWGQNTETLFADSTRQSTIRGWCGNRYYIASLGTAIPWSKTTYDNAGHVVKEETIGVSSACNAQIATSEHSYEIHGKLEKTVLKTGNYEETTTNRYGYDGSLTEHADNAHSIRYSYGSNKTTITDNGRTTTTEYDCWGNVKKITSPDGSTVNYKYFSNGKPKNITSLGSTVSLQYYPNGLKKSITDSDAGTETYVYDSFGRITQQKRGGITTTNTYTNGLLTKTKCGGITTTYSYDKQKRLTKLHNGTSAIAYAYDKYGRTTKETYSTDNKEFSYLYSYNAQGLLSSKTFPDNSIEKYSYNKYGVQTGIALDGQCSCTLYSAYKDKTGTRTTEITDGVFKDSYYNPDNTLRRMTFGSPNSGSSSDSYDYTYDRFQNLTTRMGQYSGMETFEYDATDRLTKIGSGYEYQYAPNGNILFQTGVGEYEYKASQPHAISGIDNDNRQIKSLLHKYTCTPFRKPAAIIDDHKSDSVKTYHIFYSPDNERIKSVYICNKENMTTYYLPDYEVEIVNGVTTTRHYIFSPSTGHLAAVNFKQGDKSETYYAITDHQGSVLKLVDNKVHSKYEARYTPFGVRTIVKNNLGYNFPRGYTMHEHLDQFGVINANARLYDPYLARFMSPDPYIQEPTNPQNFNRFSYCLNNPLKYSDPTGETIIGAFIIGGIVGTYIGGSLANDNYKPAKWNYNNWTTWRYMFWGSVVGGASGALGGFIATSGMPFANTASIAFSSFCNSLGTSFYSDSQTPISISFGLVSYDFTNNSWGFLGKKGNEFIENFGYAMGALANVQDLTTAVVGGGENININSASTKKGHDWWGHSSATHENGESLVSFGPDSQVDKSSSLSETWKNSIKNAKEWDTYFGKKGTWSLKLNNVSTTAISKYASGVTRWDLFFNSCVGHTTRALWRAGIPTLYTFHPHMLNVQLAIRQIGIESSPYIYQLN